MHFDIIERRRIAFSPILYFYRVIRRNLFEEIYLLWEMDNQIWIKQLITFKQIHYTLIINTSNNKNDYFCDLLLCKILKNNKNNHTQVLFISYY